MPTNPKGFLYVATRGHQRIASKDREGVKVPASDSHSAESPATGWRKKRSLGDGPECVEAGEHLKSGGVQSQDRLRRDKAIG